MTLFCLICHIGVILRLKRWDGGNVYAVKCVRASPAMHRLTGEARDRFAFCPYDCAPRCRGADSHVGLRPPRNDRQYALALRRRATPAWVRWGMPHASAGCIGFALWGAVCVCHCEAQAERLRLAIGFPLVEIPRLYAFLNPADTGGIIAYPFNASSSAWICSPVTLPPPKLRAQRSGM